MLSAIYLIRPKKEAIPELPGRAWESASQSVACFNLPPNAFCKVDIKILELELEHVEFMKRVRKRVQFTQDD